MRNTYVYAIRRSTQKVSGGFGWNGMCAEKWFAWSAHVYRQTQSPHFQRGSLLICLTSNPTHDHKLSKSATRSLIHNKQTPAACSAAQKALNTFSVALKTRLRHASTKELDVSNIVSFGNKNGCGMLHSKHKPNHFPNLLSQKKERLQRATLQGKKLKLIQIVGTTKFIRHDQI